MASKLNLTNSQSALNVPTLGRAIGDSGLVDRRDHAMRLLDNLEATVKANMEAKKKRFEESEKWYDAMEKRSEAHNKELEAINKTLETKLKFMNKMLEKRSERLNAAISTLIKCQISQYEEALQASLLHRKFETFNRILRGWSDQMFSQLGANDKRILRKAELDYITRLLEAPIDTDDYLFEPISNALGVLSAEEYSAANAILPIISQLKRECNRTTGWNWILHPPPTVNEGIAEIEQSTLGDNYKATLIATISKNPKSSSGNDLFLPMNCQTKVEDLEESIQCLKKTLETLASC